MNTRAVFRRVAPKGLLWKVAPMRLYWSDGGPMHHNFGDQLSPLIVRRGFGQSAVHSALNSCEALGLGSILEDAEEHVARTSPFIWGSGYIEDGGPWRGAAVRPRAVRGALTRSRLAPLASGPIALGGPGLLAPFVFPEYRASPKRYAVSLVPHFIDSDHPRIKRLRKLDSVHVIDVLSPVEDVIRQISESRMVVSSSLHGLIVADAFGVPNFRMCMVDGRWGADYKFEDYCSAFGQSTAIVNPEDVISKPEGYFASWEPRLNLVGLQAGLVRSFPLRPRSAGILRSDRPS